MLSFKEIRKSVMVALWLMVLTFPIMVIRVNTIDNTVEWRWENLILVGVGSLVISHVWRLLLERTPKTSRRKNAGMVAPAKPDAEVTAEAPPSLLERFHLTRENLNRREVKLPAAIVFAVLAVLFPFITSLYQTNIMITALQYVILALGLNIVIGLGGMLHLGYAAFYAVGAYTYALLNINFGISFWVALPLGGLIAAVFGILLGIPVLRLRGDYLGIVTLGFAEIVRIVLENWVGLTNGPRGIPGIDRPKLFGIEFGLSEATDFTYYIALGLVILTIFIVYRLENSRVGRAWVAMREDDIASEAMGIDITRAKLTAFSLGALWAGLAGVLFAAKTTFVSPKSFTLMESITVLLAVVLGGMGSIPGVIIGALIVSLLPEALRQFSQYRMLLFGALLVVMMVFRPGGIIQKRRRAYRFESAEEES
jgi:branched-chain amino acid transport system permease protein